MIRTAHARGRRRPGGRSRVSPIAALAALCLLAAACGEGSPGEVPAGEMERARAALAPFKEQLVGALVEGLEEGPANAIAVCRVRAPEIASGLSTGGVRMGRTSHRVRNSDNAPQPWMEPLLRAYLESPESDEPRAVRLEGGGFGYVEPIRVRTFCLSCHGPSVEPALLEEIRALYPEDRATGFRAGDFRGLFWVTMPLKEGST